MSPDVSIIVPVFNEEGAVVLLAQEIATAFADRSHEIIFVDDASVDDTFLRLQSLRSELAQLRVLRHTCNAGQSRALRTGVLAARSPFIVTVDGDGQNDPADGPRLMHILQQGPAALGLVGGVRVRRRDSLAKRLASRIANTVRKHILNDAADDTGCGLKAFRTEVFLRLPYFDHMHRYLPALVLREGMTVLFETVSHRPRTTGASKYNNLQRLIAACSDLAGVAWLRTRARDPGNIGEC